MANTYSQIYIQTVFAVKHREALIQAHLNDLGALIWVFLARVFKASL